MSVHMYILIMCSFHLMHIKTQDVTSVKRNDSSVNENYMIEIYEDISVALQ